MFGNNPQFLDAARAQILTSVLGDEFGVQQQQADAVEKFVGIKLNIRGESIIQDHLLDTTRKAVDVLAELESLDATPADQMTPAQLRLQGFYNTIWEQYNRTAVVRS